MWLRTFYLWSAELVRKMIIRNFFKKNYPNSHHQFFTLIELLVVVGIVGLIAGIIIVKVNSARMKARDSQRRADLHSVQMAVEAYVSKNQGKFPQTFQPGEPFVFRYSNINYNDGWVPGLTPNYISSLPKDPRSAANEPQYAYYYVSDGRSYKLEAIMESDTGATWALDDGGFTQARYELFYSAPIPEQPVTPPITTPEVWIAPLPGEPGGPGGAWEVTTPGWSALGSGMDDWVNVLTIYNNGEQNELIAGGNFTSAGGVSANYIAKWNGSAWSALGIGVDFVVNALAVYNGELITAGAISPPVPAIGKIAKWNGSSWSDLGTGVNDAISTLTVYKGELIAGGYFTTVGGVSANRIAKWNGSSWSDLGTGMNAEIYFLTVFNNELIAGGNFTTAGGIPANRIAKWNGSAWSALGTGMNNYIGALTVYNNELIAGGNFTSAGGVSANRIAKWNGSSWSALGTGTNGIVAEVTVYNGELIAGGLFGTAGGVPVGWIAKWNGSAWSSLGTGLNYRVEGLTVYNQGLIVGGAFTTAGGVPASYIARWDR